MTTTWKDKIFWILYACILFLLFLMSSTDLIIKEKKSEIYRVSLIVGDSKDDYYVNLKKGMDQAAVERNLDVNFITLYERNHSGQQEDLILREMEVGSHALILSPVDYTKTAAMLERITVDIPLIILNNEEPAGDKVMANISMDYFLAGQKLAEEISGDSSAEALVYLFTEGLQYGSNRRLYDGIMSILPQKGYQVILIEKAYPNRYREALETRVKKAGAASVIALDTESLLELAALIDSGGQEYETVSLYGIGSTLKILRYMERGVIQGILTENMYDAGYQIMEAAVEAIENKTIKGNLILDSFFLRPEDITKKEYEKMLYPIH